MCDTNLYEKVRACINSIRVSGISITFSREIIAKEYPVDMMNQIQNKLEGFNGTNAPINTNPHPPLGLKGDLSLRSCSLNFSGDVPAGLQAVRICLGIILSKIGMDENKARIYHVVKVTKMQ